MKIDTEALRHAAEYSFKWNRGDFRCDALDILALLAERSALLAVAQAAQTWWERKRPVAYSRDEHIANPTVNCVGQGEQALACALAAWERDGGDQMDPAR